MSSTAAMMDIACESSGSSVYSREQDMPAEGGTTQPLPNMSNNEPEIAFQALTALKEFAILATGPYSPLIQKNLPFRKRAHSVPDAMGHNSGSQPSSDHDSLPERGPSPPLNLSVSLTTKDNKGQEESLTSSTGSEATSPLMSGASPTDLRDSQKHSIYVPIAGHHKSPWMPTSPTMFTRWISGLPSSFLSPAASPLGASPEDSHLMHSVPHSSVVKSIYEADPWRLPWPLPVWHCFEHGTLIRFCTNKSQFVLRAEEVEQCRELQFLVPDRIGPIRVESIRQLESPDSLVEISFLCSASSGLAEDAQIVATCCSHHPFLVIGKGWCAVSPGSILEQYGIQCQLLERGDVARPLKMPALLSPSISEGLQRFSISPKGQGFPALSQDSMAVKPEDASSEKQEHLQVDKCMPQQSDRLLHSKAFKLSKPKAAKASLKRQTKASAKLPLEPGRTKRPMNAFMLFAQENRSKVKQANPGKDNRFVSVVLGGAWQQLDPKEKQKYVARAKALSAEEMKKNPHCWKRRKSQPVAAGAAAKVSE